MSDDRVFGKCAWRLVPVLLAAYIANYIDRTNIGFAALTMNSELGFSPAVYGFGAGIFFLSYALFQVPSNLVLHRVGARRWICFIIALWGFASTGTAFIRGAGDFYAVRFLLGIAEAGLVPGVVLYLTLWFPKAWLCRTTAIFMTATGIAPIIGGPLASFILRLNGAFGISGWRWLFVVEGLSPLLVAAAVFVLLPDRPSYAQWLTDEEKRFIEQRIRQEDAAKERSVMRALRDVRVLLLGLGYGLQLFGGYGLTLWMPLVIQQMGFSNSATGFVTALVFLAALPAMVLWARHSDQNEERIKHAAAAGLLMSASFAVAAASPFDSITLLALALAAIGAGSLLAPYYGIPPLFLTGPAMAGGFALMNAMANLLGGFGGQYAIGFLRQQTGNYSAVFAVLSASTLLTALIVLGVGRLIAPVPRVQLVTAE